MINLTDSSFHTNRTWNKPINWDSLPSNSSKLVELFDLDGYRLTELESYYADANNHPVVKHGHEMCLRQDWFVEEEEVTSGPHLNHAFLFERKGYDGEALEQLQKFGQENNLIFKLANYKGKWGLDFDMDYVDSSGHSAELLHFESNSFDFSEIDMIKQEVEQVVANTDWTFAAKKILARKAEWVNLDLVEQSKWKTDFFGLPAERFKMNAWE